MIDARYQQNRTVANAEDNFTEVEMKHYLIQLKIYTKRWSGSADMNTKFNTFRGKFV